MTLKLPRLSSLAAITDKPASVSFSRDWDKLCTAVENLTPTSVSSSSDVPTTGYVTMIIGGKSVKLAVVG